MVVLAVQHGHQLQLVHRLAHCVDGLLGLGHHLGVVLLVQHDQHGLGVVVEALQLLEAVQLALQVADLVEDFLAQLRVVVEAGAGHGVLQLLHALAGGVDGQRLFQVFHSLAVVGQLYFQFVRGDHRFIPLVSNFRITSPSRLRLTLRLSFVQPLSLVASSSPAPLVGEPLAKRRGFPVCQGLPSVGEVARRSRDGEVDSCRKGQLPKDTVYTQILH